MSNYFAKHRSFLLRLRISIQIDANNKLESYILVSDTCNREYNATAEPTRIVSAGYPGDYAASSDCVTTIYANKTEVIELIFVFFDLESSSSCSYDYIEVSTFIIIYHWLNQFATVLLTIT